MIYCICQGQVSISNVHPVCFAQVEVRKAQVDRQTKQSTDFSVNISPAVDTLATLRQLAMSSHQTLSPAFIRALIKDKGVRIRVPNISIISRGLPFFQPMAIIHSILPPLMINTALGTILFTSHSFFCYVLSRLDFFAPTETSVSLGPRITKDGQTISQTDASTTADWSKIAEEHERHDGGPEWLSFGAEDQIMFMEAIHRLPHPTLMSAAAGAAAGVLQAVIFAPIENAVK